MNFDKLFNTLAKCIYEYEKSFYKDIALSCYKASTVRIVKNEILGNELQNDFKKFIDNLNLLIGDLSTEQKVLDLIYYIVAIDSCIDIKDLNFFTMSNYPLNNEMNNKIVVFVTHFIEYDYTHSANSCLSSFLRNVVYFVKENCDVKSIYINSQLDNNCSIGYEFKIACIPYGMRETEKEIDSRVENGIEKAKYGTLKDRDKVLDERLIKSYCHAIDNGASFVFGAEMTGSEEIDNKLYENLKTNLKGIVWCPPYHIEENNDTVSKSILFNPFTLKKEIIYKSLAYNDKIGATGTYKMEDIVSKNVFIVLHVKNLGRILLLICSDFFHSSMERLISQMRIDYVIISSNTTSFNKFNDDACSFIKSDRRVMVQCNNCSANLERIKKGHDLLKPINVNYKTTNPNSKIEETLSKELIPCNTYESCIQKKLCYFMMTFVIEDSNFSLKKLDYVKEG